MSITLRLRNLATGDLLLGEFEDVEQARAWLTERPHDMEVVGVATAIDDGIADELRKAMRPLDAGEQARGRALDEARLQRMRDEITRQQQTFEAEAAAARAAVVDADPDSPMTIAYDRRDGLAHADPADTREIPQLVHDAVLAWVAERDGWVHPRGARVARATVTVWPRAVPSGDEADRCHPGGQFEVEPGLD